MRSFDSEQYIKKARRAWFFGLLGICMVYLLTSSNATSLGAMLQFPFRMIFAVIFSHLAAKYIAPFQLSIHQTMIEKAAHAKESLQQEQAQEALQKEIDSLNKESRNQQDASKTSQSKRELVMRLGSVDQFIRVLEAETEVGKRTVALQAAHSEMMTLAAKLSSGELSREAVDAPEVRELASETSKDLARLGLSEDRLSRDLTRMFKLNSK